MAMKTDGTSPEVSKARIRAIGQEAKAGTEAGQAMGSRSRIPPRRRQRNCRKGKADADVRKPGQSSRKRQRRPKPFAELSRTGRLDPVGMRLNVT